MEVAAKFAHFLHHCLMGTSEPPSSTVCRLTPVGLVGEHHITTSVRKVVASVDWLVLDIYGCVFISSCITSIYSSALSALLWWPYWFPLVSSDSSTLILHDFDKTWVEWVIPLLVWSICRISLMSLEGLMQGFCITGRKHVGIFLTGWPRRSCVIRDMWLLYIGLLVICGLWLFRLFYMIYS